MHIAIAGNIGSGKTTLTKLLSKRYGWKPNFEPVDNNPYLADYYEDMKRWSFNLQIYFLNKRFHDVVEIAQNKETIIQDRTIFEDAKIFAPNLHDKGLMSDRDFANYTDLFDLMLSRQEYGVKMINCVRSEGQIIGADAMAQVDIPDIFPHITALDLICIKVRHCHAYNVRIHLHHECNQRLHIDEICLYLRIFPAHLKNMIIRITGNIVNRNVRILQNIVNHAIIILIEAI